jgi:hypothetical protein
MRGPPYRLSASSRNAPPLTSAVATSPSSSTVQALVLLVKEATFGTDASPTLPDSTPSDSHGAIGAMVTTWSPCLMDTEPALPAATASPGAACAGTVTNSVVMAVRAAVVSVLRSLMCEVDLFAPDRASFPPQAHSVGYTGQPGRATRVGARE